MKVWIDDVRPVPNDTWTLVTNSVSAMSVILIHYDEIEEISFDHDLGETWSGDNIAKMILYMVYGGMLKSIPKWNIHSANPIGAQNIKNTMELAEKVLNERDS